MAVKSENKITPFADNSCKRGVVLKKIGKSTYKTEKNPAISFFASAVGQKEGEGPLGKFFDRIFQDMYAGETTWEKAESRLQKTVAQMVLNKSKRKGDDVDLIFAGDLLNQCTASAFGMRDFDIPYMGQYGACSTMIQSIIAAVTALESGGACSCLCVTSSHFCSAERQYRYPLEYGGFRTPTAQWTVTGAGGCLVELSSQGAVIEYVVPGKIVDLGIKDANNMGAAMAPAAADTIGGFFRDTNTCPQDYDRIFTGDLGVVGSEILSKLLRKEGFDISSNHNDCGAMIFDCEKQNVCAGGSGCGCCASVLCSYILKSMEKGELNNVLVIATGALLSPTTSGQNQSIPGIAHLINIKNRKNQTVDA